MKTSIRYSLTSASAFFALCASVVACGPGGGYYSYPSYSSYQSCPSYTYDSNPSEVTSIPVSEPVVVSQPPAATVTVAPTAPAPVAKVAAVKTAPKSHITVVSAKKTEAPVGRIKLASPIAAARPATATIRQVPTEDTTPAPALVKPAPAEVAAVKPEVAKTTPEPVKPAKTEEPVAKVDLNKSLETLEAAKEETSKIAESLKGLVGTWLAVSRQGDGELSTVELQLNDNGWAKLTVPGADGKPSTTTRKVEVENNEIKLTGADADVTLGKLVEFDSRQMVLERSGGQVTFVRP